MRGTVRVANDAWEALLEAHAVLIRGFITEGDWSQVSMREYDVLYTLSKSAEPVRLGELHRHVLLSQPALSRMVDRLVSRGLVRRMSDPADARGVLVSLTEHGQATQRQVGRGHARSVASAMTEAMTVDDLIRLEELCLALAGDDRRSPSSVDGTHVPR